MQNDIEIANRKFNEELQMQIDGLSPKGHKYLLGKPGAILRSMGMENLEINMMAKMLSDKAHEDYHHPFDIADVRNLPKMINDPVAVFAYGDRSKSVNIVIDAQKEDKNFLAGLSLNPEIDGVKLNIHSIRTVFPKDTAEWVNWIYQGKALYLNKEKVSDILANPRLPGEVTKNPTLINIIENFTNPPIILII